MRLEQRILRDIRQPGLLAQRPHAGVGNFIASQNFQQAGFAAAIGTDQAGAVSLRQAERKIIE